MICRILGKTGMVMEMLRREMGQLSVCACGKGGDVNGNASQGNGPIALVSRERWGLQNGTKNFKKYQLATFQLHPHNHGSP